MSVNWLTNIVLIFVSVVVLFSIVRKYIKKEFSIIGIAITYARVVFAYIILSIFTHFMLFLYDGTIINSFILVAAFFYIMHEMDAIFYLMKRFFLSNTIIRIKMCIFILVVFIPMSLGILASNKEDLRFFLVGWLLTMAIHLVFYKKVEKE